ncbi:MAG: S8 family peptidase [bacterium]|nr:S8 family peptidase [bacterium]
MNKTKFSIGAVLTIALTIAIMGVGSLHAQGNPNRVIVTLKDGIVYENARKSLEKIGGVVVRELPSINAVSVILPDNASEKALKGLVEVERVEEDVIVFATKSSGRKPGGDTAPPAPQRLDWGVDRIDAELSLNTGAGIKVAVIDTGIDADHPDLAVNIKGGINFVAKGRRGADPSKWDDDNGHGTHVAGTIAGVNNTIGVVGVAPNAQLYAVKSLDSRGSGYLSDIIAGLEWAVANNMDVVNMSLGTTSDIQAFHDAVDATYSAGVVLVAAAGNSGDGDPNTNNVEYPAKYLSVIAVGATDISDGSPYWSSDGEEVEVSAPGVNIYSTYKGGVYATMSGTSMASPHVAGVVALLLESNPLLIPADVRSVLQTTADNLGAPGRDNVYGYGLVDALFE